jgi:hypothetical protein
MWVVEISETNNEQSELAIFKHTNELYVKEKYNQKIYDYFNSIRLKFQTIAFSSASKYDIYNNIDLYLELINVFLKYDSKVLNNKKAFSIKLFEE